MIEDDVCFITDIDGNVESEDCCSGFAIKWCTKNFQLGSFNDIFVTLKHRNWETFLHLLWRYWGIFSIQMLRKMTASIMVIQNKFDMVKSMLIYVMISVLCSAADTVSFGSWFIISRVLSLNFAIMLHVNNFSLDLGSVADFSNPGTRGATSTIREPLFARLKGDVVWMYSLN